MKVRNARTGKWIELPDGDGTIWHPYLRRYVSLDKVKLGAEARMAAHDAMPIAKRYAVYVAGVKGLTKPWLVELRRDKHTPTLDEYKAIQVENLL